MNRPAIVVSDLDFSYGARSILREVHVSIQVGEFIGVIGPNGGGKTTLIKLLMGFLTPSKGSIELLGKSPKQARREIGYVPQALRFDRDFPIPLFDLVLMGALSSLPPLGPIPKIWKTRAEQLIERLGLAPHRDQNFGKLSGGLAQRALLARALLSDPPILLLDEPTANIDPPSAGLIFELLEEFKGKKTIVLVTHDLKTTVERVDRIVCVEGTAHSFLASEVCEHFAFGLYHTPLLSLPKNHFKEKR